MLKIAFFSPVPFSEKLGATKNRIEFAHALRGLGCETFLLDKEEIGFGTKEPSFSSYCEAFKSYLQENAENFDVIVYEYNTLPYKRTLFSEKPLFVARPALLAQGEGVEIPISLKVTLKTFIKVGLAKLRIRREFDQRRWEAERNISLKESDLIQVQNLFDVKWLIGRGYNKEKIVMVPNGISEKRLPLFKALQRNFEPPFKIAFVGTFDFRKGAMDFPYILQKILDQFPNTKFKLLGTRGLFKTKEKVLNFFPKKLRQSINVSPSFEPMDLPELLADCHLGIFPSYYESFGFGALEMMSAGLPVVAYKSAGPADYILPELLVEIGDKKTMAEKVNEILGNKDRLMLLSMQAEKITDKYNWETIAKKALVIYRKEMLKRSKEQVPG